MSIHIQLKPFFVQKGHFYIQIAFFFNVNKSYGYLRIFVLLCSMFDSFNKQLFISEIT